MKIFNGIMLVGLLLAAGSIVAGAASDVSPPNPDPSGTAACTASGSFTTCTQNRPSACAKPVPPNKGDEGLTVDLVNTKHCWLHVYNGASGPAVYHLKLADWPNPARHSQCDPIGLASAVTSTNAVRVFECEKTGPLPTGVVATYRTNSTDCRATSFAMAPTVTKIAAGSSPTVP